MLLLFPRRRMNETFVLAYSKWNSVTDAIVKTLKEDFKTVKVRTVSTKIGIMAEISVDVDEFIEYTNEQATEEAKRKAKLKASQEKQPL